MANKLSSFRPNKNKKFFFLILGVFFLITVATSVVLLIQNTTNKNIDSRSEASATDVVEGPKVSGTIIDVCADSCTMKTLSDALKTVKDGDTILLKTETFDQQINLSDASFPAGVTNLTIKGLGPEETKLILADDISNQHTVVLANLSNKNIKISEMSMSGNTYMLSKEALNLIRIETSADKFNNKIYLENLLLSDSQGENIAIHGGGNTIYGDNVVISKAGGIVDISEQDDDLPGMRIVDSTVNFKNSTITDNPFEGVRLHGGTATFDSCLFSKSGLQGIRQDGGNLTVSNSAFEKNIYKTEGFDNNAALLIDGTSATLIRNNIFKDNKKNAINVTSTGATPVTISNNIITGNFRGVQTGGQVNVIIDNNSIFKNNDTGLSLASRHTRRDCGNSSNYDDDDKCGETIDGGSSSITVRNNIVVQNMKKGIAIEFDPRKKDSPDEEDKIEGLQAVDSNNFWNNLDGDIDKRLINKALD